MTCLTCGATLDGTETTCPVCAAPIESATSPQDAEVTRPLAERSEETPSGEAPGDAPRAGSSTASGAPASAGALPSGTEGARSSGAYGPDAGGPGAYGPGAGGPGAGGPGAVGPGAGGAGWYPQPPHPSGLSSEVRGWGIAAHLLGLGGALATVITLGFLGPLFVWLIKRDDHPFIDHHAKESLNFQLTTLVALVVGLVAAIPIFLLGFLTLGVLWVVAGVVVMAAVVVWFVFPIIGAVRAANGEGYRYPVNIRFVK
jgi:uncharacterized protein